MAVHTEVGVGALGRLLVDYGFDRVVSVEPANHGIENSNYFVDASSATGTESLVVTLFESALPGDGFLFSLLDHLTDTGLTVPVPLTTRSGARMTALQGRPVCVVNRFPGKHPRVASTKQCGEIGRFLARMHLAAKPLVGEASPHPRDTSWLQEKASEVGPLLDASTRHLLDKALHMVVALLERSDVQALPTGIVHGDLFRDNALFETDQLVAVIDFHHASKALLAFDLAVALNDWAVNAEGSMRHAARDALIDGYGEVRGLTLAETVYLDALRLHAALCFWLSRLLQVKHIAAWRDTYLPAWRLDRVLATGNAKDPRWFQRLVEIQIDGGTPSP